MAENQDISINQPKVGMNLNSPQGELKSNEYRILVNGNIQSKTGDFVNIVNEYSNILCSSFKKGYVVIGTNVLTSLNKTLFFLVNPTTNDSEIGEISNISFTDVDDKQFLCSTCNVATIEDTPLELKSQKESCIYSTIVSAKCLLFSENNPIRSWVKIDDCNIRIYFTDGSDTGLRYIDYDYQKKEIPGCPSIETDELDCDKIKVFKENCYPKIDVLSVSDGGNNEAGLYQFAICYADAVSNPIGHYFYVTNPVPLFLEEITLTKNYPINQSINLRIYDLNTDFKYLNLVVIKTINSTKSAYLVQTLSIDSPQTNYVYSGVDKNLLENINLEELFARYPYYTSAENLEVSNGYLFWYNLKQERVFNLQPVINKLRLKWQTVELNEGDYKNPIICNKYRSLLRDEVYPYAIEFTKKNGGTNTARFHIPAPSSIEVPSAFDIENISNNDVFAYDNCEEINSLYKWQVYNLATETDYACGYSPVSTNVITVEDIVQCSSYPFGGTLSNPQLAPYTGSNPPVDSECWTDPEQVGISGTRCVDSLIGTTYPSSSVVSFISSELLEIVPSTELIFCQYDDCVCVPFPTRTPDIISFPEDVGKPDSYALPYSTYTACNTALLIEPSPNSSCTQWNAGIYNFQILPKIPSPSGYSDYCCPSGTTGYDDNAVWYKFVATNTGHAVSVAIDTAIENNLQIEFWEGTCSSGVFTGNRKACKQLTDSCQCAGTQCDGGANSYLTFNEFIPGRTYYIKIFTPDPTTIPDKGTFIDVCLSTPTPLDSPCTTEIIPAVTILSCKYKITYQKTALTDSNCYANPYKYGNFGYWESTETYPCNEEVWGDLAGTPIRHYKFPDFHTSPFFKNPNPTSFININEVDSFNIKNKIYPIGVIVDVNEIKTLLNEAVDKGLISEEEKLSICGYRILRGNRIGNQSIIAKGLLYDVWSYKDQLDSDKKTDILYPNYPYNDLNDDIFLSNTKINTAISIELNRLNNGFSQKHPYKNSNYKNNKYTFHSPNTSFNKPSKGGELKLECIQYGYSYGSFNQVKNHSKYQYIGAGLSAAAIGFATTEVALESIIAASTANANVLYVSVLGTGTYIPLGYILALVGLNFSAPAKILNKYYEWFDLLEKFAPYRNYANYYSSVGRYVDAYGIYGDVSNTQFYHHNSRRRLLNSEYLKSGMFNVGDGFNTKLFNNSRRESSVYLNIDKDLPKPSLVNADFSVATFEDFSRWCVGTISNNRINGVNTSFYTNCNQQYAYRPIVSYYAAIKNNIPNQYGNINDIEYIDTGYNGVINWTNNNQESICDTIFGGDTFINRFSIKRKHPFFIEERVGSGFVDNSDVIYSELFNVAYPRFFFNYPTTSDSSSSSSLAIFGNVALKNSDQIDYNMSCESYTGKSLNSAGLASGITGATGAGIVGIPGISITYGILAGFTYKDLNPSNAPVFIEGKIFLYSYGIPSFICESDYNIDYRYGENYREKAFYPYVGDIKEWTQETNVPISEDNYYFYNIDYSDQNKENFGYVLSADYKKETEDCKVVNTNRVIYSLQDVDNNSKFDGNLIYLANNYYDFSKYGGKLKLIKGIENNKLLVIQEDLASVFNSYISLQTDIANSFIGTNTLFSATPQQYLKTDLGFGGTQHSAFVSTEFGHFWTDCKRGNILQFKDGIKSIGDEELSNWLKENLPFRITKQFPEVNTDNPYKYFGITMVYDNRFKRIFITKRDHEVKKDYLTRVSFVDNEFYLDKVKKIYPTDSEYFINKSWTIAYSLLIGKIISFYTFTPNYYVPSIDYFSSGVNYPTNELHDFGLWSHLLTSKSFQVFYGKLHPFLFEYQTENKISNFVLDSLSYQADFQRFTSQYDYYTNNFVTFNNLFIYNINQSSGNITLIPKIKNNLFQNTLYPRVNTNGFEVLVENVENYWRVNNFQNVYLNNNQPIMKYLSNPMYKEVNQNAVSYSLRYIPEKLRSNYFNIILGNTDKSNYMINLRFNINQKTKSNV